VERGEVRGSRAPTSRWDVATMHLRTKINSWEAMRPCVHVEREVREKTAIAIKNEYMI
jgi:hypothetical protein